MANRRREPEDRLIRSVIASERITKDEAVRRLKGRGLVRQRGASLVLTDRGRRALRRRREEGS